jgi:tRNA1(Val) A37 N6-methylase TrmN6
VAQHRFGRAGEIIVFPLWAGPDKPAKRIIVRARKAIETATRLTPGLVLHQSDGAYTAAAEAVLRHGAPLTVS